MAPRWRGATRRSEDRQAVGVRDHGAPGRPSDEGRGVGRWLAHPHADGSPGTDLLPAFAAGPSVEKPCRDSLLRQHAPARLCARRAPTETGGHGPDATTHAHTLANWASARGESRACETRVPEARGCRGCRPLPGAPSTGWATNGRQLWVHERTRCDEHGSRASLRLCTTARGRTGSGLRHGSPSSHRPSFVHSDLSVTIVRLIRTATVSELHEQWRT